MSRGPRTHQARLADDGTWKCDCGDTGTGKESRDAHQAAKAKAALRRLDDGHAFALIVIGTRGKLEQAAVQTLGHRWYRDPGLRRYMLPFYDGYGVLAGVLDWENLAYAVAAGRFNDVGVPDDEVLTRIQIALALVGAYEIKLPFLRQLRNQDARRTVREALAELLHQDG
jgi:hypothetical protein